MMIDDRLLITMLLLVTVRLKAHSFSFLLSLLLADVQPSSGPQHRDRVMVQCISPRRGGELVGVRGCVHECREGGISST